MRPWRYSIVTLTLFLVGLPGSAEATLGSVAFEKTSVTGGGFAHGMALLTVTHPLGPLPPVSLSSSNPAVASVPASVVVAPGKFFATFTVTTSPVASPVKVTISATHAGVMKKATLTIRPATLSQFLLDVGGFPKGLKTGGEPVEFSVSLTGKALSGGVDVSITNSHPAVVLASPAVRVPGDLTHQAVSVNTTAVTENTKVTLSASYGGVTKSVMLELIPPLPTLPPPVLSYVALISPRVTGGGTVPGTVFLYGTTPVGPISLASSQPAVAAPTNPTLQCQCPGSHIGDFNVATIPVTQETPVLISASHDGVTRTVALTVLPTELTEFHVGPPTIVTGGTAVIGSVSFVGAAPSAGLLLSLASSDVGAATVPASVSVAAGQAHATFPISTRRVSQPTFVTISVSYGGKTATDWLILTR
jgi:hypothetical protein